MNLTIQNIPDHTHWMKRSKKLVRIQLLHKFICAVDDESTNLSRVRFDLFCCFSFLEFGKCQIILTLIITFALLGSTIESVNLSFILPYAKCDLRFTIREQGLLSGISFLGFAVTPHLWGFLADTWGRKKVLQVVATVGFIFSFLSAFAANTISMIVGRFVAGAL